MTALIRHWNKWSGWYLFLTAVSARLWLLCMDAAHGEVERARIAVRRDQCITKSNVLRRGDYSGVCCRGVVYD
ncbi:TPA: hypothetical protein JDL67_000812 [Salmonella enterica subsp. salamae]|nr:hypothetical protein [Salmonella enterica subsp. salamae]